MTFDAWWQGRGRRLFAERLPAGAETDGLRLAAWAAFNAGEVEQADRAKGRVAALTAEAERLRSAAAAAGGALRAALKAGALTPELDAVCREALERLEPPPREAPPEAA